MEDKQIIADISTPEITDLHRSTEDSQLNTKAQRVACLLINQGMYLFDAFHPFLSLQGDDKTFITVSFKFCQRGVSA